MIRWSHPQNAQNDSAQTVHQNSIQNITDQ